MADDLKSLLYFVKEREAMRLRKEVNKRIHIDGLMTGWTEDPILGEYRFCNVRRKDDRASLWLRDNVLTEDNIKLDLRSFLEFSAFCRWCNWPPTIKAILEAKLYPVKSIDWRLVAKLIDGVQGKAWTGAYMIRAGDKPGQPKGEFICQEVIATHFRKIIPELVERLEDSYGSFRQIHTVLQTAPNFGSFMSGQVAGDWTYTSLLCDAPDLKTWAPMGPGSIRGFNRIIGNSDLKQKPSEGLWQEKIIEWRAAIVKKLGPEYEDIDGLSVQNCLCEVDKYLRTKLGEGKPRSKYRPETAY